MKFLRKACTCIVGYLSCSTEVISKAAYFGGILDPKDAIQTECCSVSEVNYGRHL